MLLEQQSSKDFLQKNNSYLTTSKTEKTQDLKTSVSIPMFSLFVSYY